MLLRPSQASLESPGLCFASFLIFFFKGIHCFFEGFLDMFEVPGPVLEASWRSWRHLGPLEGFLKRLERILNASWRVLGAS